MEIVVHRRALLAIALLMGLIAFQRGTAGATGTARIVHPDGSQKTYADVRIAVRDQAMWITSHDGRGTLVFGKAACTKVDALLECLPYDATLFQNGEKRHIPLRSGTVWMNPTKINQPLTHSSTQVPPHGVLLAVETKTGTYVTLTGVIDEVSK
ncbi:MAG TPA: hypothetical protein VN936_02205 [Candidatus Acidoferrum sp.]|nr:hypothetical protein [Candidatus Acidoferrum sp.]